MCPITYVATERMIRYVCIIVSLPSVPRVGLGRLAVSTRTFVFTSSFEKIWSTISISSRWRTLVTSHIMRVTQHIEQAFNYCKGWREVLNPLLIFCPFQSYQICLTSTLQIVSHTPEWCQCVLVHTIFTEPKCQHSKKKNYEWSFFFKLSQVFIVQHPSWISTYRDLHHNFTSSDSCMVANVTLASSVMVFVALKYCLISKMKNF